MTLPQVMQGCLRDTPEQGCLQDIARGVYKTIQGCLVDTQTCPSNRSVEPVREPRSLRSRLPRNLFAPLTSSLPLKTQLNQANGLVTN